MGLFPPAPGGGENVSHGYKGKGVLIHLLTDGAGKPLAIINTSASGNERLQVKPLLEKAPLKLQTSMLVLEADKGYDSASLRSQLLNMNVFPFIPYRKNSKKATPFKEKFLMKSKRWKVERSFAWLKRKCRRLLMKWERKFYIWTAFTVLGQIFMWLEYLLR